MRTLPRCFPALLAALLCLTACGNTDEGLDEPGTASRPDAGGGSIEGGSRDAGTPATPPSTPGNPTPSCTPRCSGKVCGPDGCGGSCGSCASGTACDGSGRCVCVPRCEGKVCGSDGCGGTCGSCPANATCSSSGDSCGCAEGYVPDPRAQTCLRIGGACSGVSPYGYCSGDTWVRCDAQQGLVAMYCGAGRCKTVNSQGEGACRCGSIDANGVCASADGTSSSNAVHFTCATNLDVLMADNCAAATGSATGFCSTFVTSFGSQTMCFCDPCSYAAGGQCRQVCSSRNACRYNAPGNFVTCF